jgi:hypothetical protein
MYRRQFSAIPLPLLASLFMLVQQRAYAFSLGDLTNAEASQGLETALEKGAKAAIDLLGLPGGFLENKKVRIPLPGSLQHASHLLRTFGQGNRFDELETAMNRAAETDVPLARDLLVSAVKTMSVNDAKQILTGGETSVTTFFANKIRVPLQGRFLPVVTQATAQVGLVAKYNQVASRAADMGLLKRVDANIAQYVTAKSLDGLFVMISEEEKKIRKGPAATGSALLQKVFGDLK